jgi:hypothetical protein
MEPGPLWIALPAGTVPETAIGDGACIRVGDGGRRARFGYGDVIWASAAPQPNKAMARKARRKRFIEASRACRCLLLSFGRPADLGGQSPTVGVSYF